jgi:hypothetical protein
MTLPERSTPADLASHIADRLDEDHPKDASDLDRLFAVQGAALDATYVKRWLERIVPAGDARHGLLANLVRRFGSPRQA